MMEKKIVVPVGMLEAANTAITEFIRNPPSEPTIPWSVVLEAALRWQNDNLFPGGCIDDEVLDTCMRWVCANGHINLRDLLEELKRWRVARNTFLAPNPDDPIKDLLVREFHDRQHSADLTDQEINDKVRKAYQRGLTDGR